MRRICTIIGTRPEIIRLSLTINKLDKVFDHHLVHTGQNYDYSLNKIFFEELGIRMPDHHLDVVGDDLGDTLGNIISKSYHLLEKLKPDAIVVLGDTNSSLAILSAKRLKIPIFHLEAGNRCFDYNVPEEINRRLADKLSDVNLCYTDFARRNLLQEGHHVNFTFVIGSPMKEVLDHFRSDYLGSNILKKLNLDKHQYILVSLHRQENVDDKECLEKILSGIKEVSEKYGKEVIFSVHPRTQKKLDLLKISFAFRFLEPFGFFDFVNLEKNSFCVLSDSGSLGEESSIISFPAVSLRTSSERQEAIEHSSLVLGGNSPDSILEATSIVIERSKSTSKSSSIPQEYLFDNTSDRTLSIIVSYIDKINKELWLKS